MTGGVTSSARGGAGAGTSRDGFAAGVEPGRADFACATARCVSSFRRNAVSAAFCDSWLLAKTATPPNTAARPNATPAVTQSNPNANRRTRNATGTDAMRISMARDASNIWFAAPSATRMIAKAGTAATAHALV